MAQIGAGVAEIPRLIFRVWAARRWIVAPSEIASAQVGFRVCVDGREGGDSRSGDVPVPEAQNQRVVSVDLEFHFVERADRISEDLSHASRWIHPGGEKLPFGAGVPAAARDGVAAVQITLQTGADVL